jgi:integrase
VNIHNIGIRPISLKDGLEEHISRGSTWWNGDTIRERKSVLRGFLAFNGDTQLANISRPDIKAYIEHRRDKAAKTRKGDISNLYPFFNDAIDHDLLKENPVAGVSVKERSRKPDDGILTPEQTKTFLRIAMNDGHEELAACFVLMAFVGVRAKETYRLDWDEISFHDKYVFISQRKAKNPQARHIEMTDAALAWLSILAKKSGPVCTSAMFTRYWKKVRDKSEIKPWPSNALRHSYGSYFLAHAKDAALTSCNMGNTVKVINSNYRKPVGSEAVNEFWSILPKENKGIIMMPKASAG